MKSIRAETNISVTYFGAAPKLRALKNLAVLGWGGANDASMVYMKDFPNLGELWLQRSKVSDVGLKHLHGLPKLGELGLPATGISKEAIDALRKSYSREIRIVRE